jgi:hypothetical protein
MKKFLQRFPESIARLSIVFIFFITAVLLVRFLIPDSLKNGKEHRTATVEREVAKPLQYAGSDACADCHEQYQKKKEGYHRNLSCETCHGIAKAHAENPEIKPAINKKREACTLCHNYNPSRPTGFPQINPVVHNPLKQCDECHNPHDPKPPRTPRECQACHQQIERTKSVSAHVQLECTNCHTVTEQHKISPRQVKANIPNDRSFCGKCHAQDSKNKEAQKIDINTHGEKYLCWQCHYPHMPEVN